MNYAFVCLYLAPPPQIYSIYRMDNLSHAVFGSSIIHALWGKKYGRKATVFALLASNIPDIDVLARLLPGVSSLQAWLVHRTTTHSLLFAVVVAPLIGLVAARCYKTWRASWKDWSLITLVAILSHIFLDRCTTYGIWFLWPFSSVGYEANIINVIDFFFTIPLLAIVIAYLAFPLKKIAIGVWRFLGIVFAACYLAGMSYVSHRAHDAIARDMEVSHTEYSSIFVTPQFFQPFLRYGVVTLPDNNYKITYLSARDTKPRVYQALAGNHACSSVLSRDAVAQRLIERTHGLYMCQTEGSTYRLTDLRFGRINGWDTTVQTPWTFSYLINPTVTPYVITQTHQHITGSFRDLWTAHWKRVWGQH